MEAAADEAWLRRLPVEERVRRGKEVVRASLEKDKGYLGVSWGAAMTMEWAMNVWAARKETGDGVGGCPFLCSGGECAGGMDWDLGCECQGRVVDGEGIAMPGGQ